MRLRTYRNTSIKRRKSEDMFGACSRDEDPNSDPRLTQRAIIFVGQKHQGLTFRIETLRHAATAANVRLWCRDSTFVGVGDYAQMSVRLDLGLERGLYRRRCAFPEGPLRSTMAVNVF